MILVMKACTFLKVSAVTLRNSSTILDVLDVTNPVKLVPETKLTNVSDVYLDTYSTAMEPVLNLNLP